MSSFDIDGTHGGGAWLGYETTGVPPEYAPPPPEDDEDDGDDATILQAGSCFVLDEIGARDNHHHHQ